MAPTFVIVPGAWHVKTFASPLIKQLETAGYPAQAITLPTVNSTKTVAEDTSYLRNEVIVPLLDAGKDVVMIIHSYGAFPGSAAVQGLGRSARKNGSGAVLGVILVAAFIPVEGKTLVDMIGGALPPDLDINEEKATMRVIDPKHFFYEDVPEPLLSEAISALGTHSFNSFHNKAGPLGFAEEAYNGRRGYIRTIQDVCFPMTVQDGMIEGSGIDWDIKTMDTSHSPFLSKTEELAEHLLDYVKRWS